MGKRESYAPGTFCWVDLSTSDVDGAKAFYGELFGWEFEDSDLPGGGVYTMCRVEGDEVAAIVRQDEQPGHWNNYVAVTSADETAAKAKKLGADVIEEPFDVMEAGRMAVLADPDGAVLCIWEPREHAGASRVNDPGCLTWNDLQTKNPSPAIDFYAALLEWGMEPMEEDGKLVYVTIKNAGSSNGGIMPSQNGGPPFWLPYFTVASSEDVLRKARELGGEVLAGPLDIGAGSISVVRDPQGAVFATYEGETDD